MHQTITKIRGLTVNVEVLEVHDQDANGGTIWYYAAFYVQVHGRAGKRLMRRSRLPGAAAELKKEIAKNGLQAFRRLIA